MELAAAGQMVKISRAELSYEHSLLTYSPASVQAGFFWPRAVFGSRGEGMRLVV